MVKEVEINSTLSEVIRKTQRVVVKIGSSVLVGADEKLSHKALLGIAGGIAAIRRRKVEVILVTSGAIASGMEYLGFSKKPQKISELQACAAIGQPILMRMYQEALAPNQLQVAQILLTRNDLEDKNQFTNARHTLNELLSRSIIPIINENDSVVVEEIRVGDNDNLAALVTHLADADLLILLTDQDGFYTADPRKDSKAKRIPVIENVDGDISARAADTSKVSSVGGMKTKLEAAKKAGEKGIPTLIADGRNAEVLQSLFDGKLVGTLIAAGTKK
jgi:glutamate 5-kinase